MGPSGSWGIIKCGTSWKWLIVERNGWKFGTRGPRKSISRVFDHSRSFGSFEFILGHLVHFTKFPVLRYSKGHGSHGFHPFWTKPYRKCGNQGEYRLLTFLAIRQNLKTLWLFDFLPNTGPYLAEISKRYCPYNFNLMSGRLQAITFLGNQLSYQVIKNVTLTWESMGKS